MWKFLLPFVAGLDLGIGLATENFFCLFMGTVLVFTYFIDRRIFP